MEYMLSLPFLPHSVPFQRLNGLVFQSKAQAEASRHPSGLRTPRHGWFIPGRLWAGLSAPLAETVRCVASHPRGKDLEQISEGTRCDLAPCSAAAGPDWPLAPYDDVLWLRPRWLLLVDSVYLSLYSTGWYSILTGQSQLCYCSKGVIP